MKQEFPLVSVITPLYNSESFIAETIDSVMASDYPSFEMVIVDDGSTDKSLKIALEYAKNDYRIKVFSQKNSGACAARNHAISMAKGEFILPIDSDDTISPNFISDAIREFKQDPDIKVVCPRADFFGNRTGEWKLADFSLELISRKNIIPISAMYRKKEWEAVNGYCENIIAREDWDFWINILKNGGKVAKLSNISLHYRYHKNSKRVSDRKLKKHVINILNQRHPQFFEKMHGGPLRYHRSWSKHINRIYRFFNPRKVIINENYTDFDSFIKVMPTLFSNNFGSIIYSGRNELREMEYNGEKIIVKSFRKPNIINRFIYGFFRSSKAERSYKYAQLLRDNGIASPEPIAYYTERKGILFSNSYYVNRKSECQHTYYDLLSQDFANLENIVRAIARVAAKMHEKGFLHKDFSRGNILFQEMPNGIHIEIIDLNRIRFRKIGLKDGCQNFERLPATPQMHRWIAEEYAKARGLDQETCFKLITNYRKNNE